MRNQQIRTGAPLHQQGCLFCCKRDGGFLSREHILSESLGNDNAILPPGIVCDRCNNGPLARADRELTDFPLVSLRRAERGLPTKAGKAAVSRWADGLRIVFPEEGTLQLLNPSRKVARGMRDFDPARRVSGKLELTSAWRYTDERVGRLAQALWKATLEFIYLDRGAEIAFGSELDRVRRAILGLDHLHGWIVMPTLTTRLRNDCQLTYEMRAGSVSVVADVLGVIFMTNLLRTDCAPNLRTIPFEANLLEFGLG